ncbi:MAG: stage III sporulation protein AB [Clostridia bacterium]|nr:stage III sporulation protein AB [Clostridia bacterium]MDE6472409.1 stage III sporulation protein AB [Clostridia bacterium]
MLRLAIGGVLCFVSAYLGIAGKKYFDKRCKYLKDFSEFLSLLRDGISYAKDKLPQIGRKFIASGKGAFYTDVGKYIDLVEQGNPTDEQVAKCYDSKYISKHDKVLLKEFFSQLGKFDYDTQMSRLDMTSTQLRKTIEKAEKDCRTTGNLMPKLGLVIGIAIMIFLA